MSPFARCTNVNIQVNCIKKLIKPNGAVWSADEIENEVLLTSMLNHPNIIHVYGYCEDELVIYQIYNCYGIVLVIVLLIFVIE